MGTEVFAELALVLSKNVYPSLRHDLDAGDLSPPSRGSTDELRLEIPLATGFREFAHGGNLVYLPRDSWVEKISAWVVSAAILLPVFILLTRLNAGLALEKRIYRYANL